LSVQRSETAQPWWKLLRRKSVRRDDLPLLGHRANGDMLIAGAGLALAIGCALLPWYVFLNQEKFGIRALKFEGREGAIPAPRQAHQPGRIRQPISPEEVPLMNLDLLSTGTLPQRGDPPVEAVPVDEQPFPGQVRPAAEYRLVHVANGRAMLEDENGLWVVQPGSRLPDGSKIASIQKRDGAWIVATDRNQTLTLAD
jgi:hypothetical protein